ncbi:MAG: glycosyl transferase family 1 [Desulfobacteraceae bacterium 4572_35.1]|nr:MAG: glycosyl transferase family 1 [Desulfobacteraceae bacterium 4572_35.1]
MKVLSFSYCFPGKENPTWGMFVYQRLAALHKLEEVRVCSPVPWFPVIKNNMANPDEQVWHELAVYRPRFFYFPAILKNYDARLYALGLKHWLKDLCNGWRPDVLDAHFIWPDGVGVALLAQELGIPYVITLRGKLYECLKVPSQTQQCAQALQGAAAVISVSSRMANEAATLGVAQEQLHVITNGVDCDHFRPRDRSNCRKQLSLPEEGRLLVTVAHLGQRKGHHEVIQALAALPDDVRLVIVGAAAQGGNADGLRELARNVGVEKRLILPGPQPYDKIPLYFSAADASVLASYREGCPNVVLESLATGTPVIATDVGAVPDILPVPAVGRIVEPQKVDPLRDAMAEVLNQQWDAEVVVRASGVRSWTQVAKEVRDVFENLF